MTREQKLERCLGFFASVIKSGEPWTETCEREYRAALSPPSPSTSECACGRETYFVAPDGGLFHADDGTVADCAPSTAADTQFKREDRAKAAESERDAARAEVERLRGALRGLADATAAYSARHKADVCDCPTCDTTRAALTAARTVLGEEGTR